jgi:hypothetical protein
MIGAVGRSMSICGYISRSPLLFLWCSTPRFTGEELADAQPKKGEVGGRFLA